VQQTITTTNVLPPPAPDRKVEPAAPPAPVAAPSVAARPGHVNANDPSCVPEFPAAAQRAGTTGISRIRLTVDATGKVTNAEVVGSSGPTRENRLLDNAAKAAFSSCKAIPGIDENGHPTGSTFVAEYVWKLE
jgi:protein TonB